MCVYFETSTGEMVSGSNLVAKSNDAHYRLPHIPDDLRGKPYLAQPGLTHKLTLT
jgi:hypothetical protein